MTDRSSAPAAPHHRLRISAIRFLNPAPLMWDFEHPPRSPRLADRYDIHYALPSECAAELAAGAADIGLIPVAAYATTPGLAVLPGCAIASLGRVRSILLVIRLGVPLESIRTIAADTSSRSSIAYAQILLRKFHSSSPDFLPHPPDLESMLAHADAALLIGDPALLALEHRFSLEQKTGERFEYCDIAAMWTERTGLPWIAAVWAIRPESLDGAAIPAAQVIADFQGSRDHGLLHIDDLVAEWSPRIAIPPSTIRHYLSRNIYYQLDDECLAGLGLFFRYAAETGILPAAPPLRLLQP